MEHRTSTHHEEVTTPNCEETSNNSSNPQLEILQRTNRELLQPEAIKLLKNEVDWAENVQLRYEQDIAILRSELEKLTPEYVANQNQLMLLEVENGRLNTEVQQAEQLLTQQTGELRSLSGELYTLKKQVAILSCQCSEKDSEIKLLKDHNDYLAVLLKESKKNVATDKPQPKKQESELAAKTEEIQELQQKLKELQSEKEQWRDELLKKDDSTKNLEKKIETLEHKICEMSESDSQNQTQCATLQQQIDEFISKEYKLALRDQNILDADNHKLHLGGDVCGELESVHNQLQNIQADKIKVQKKLAQKSCRVPLADNEMVVLRQGHTKDLISKYQPQDFEIQQKQLLVSQVKATKTQEQLLESGQRPLKRSFLETTASSVAKKMCTQNLSDKENSVAINTPSVPSSLALIK